MMALYRQIYKDGKWNMYKEYCKENYGTYRKCLLCLNGEDYENMCKMVAEFYVSLHGVCTTKCPYRIMHEGSVSQELDVIRVGTTFCSECDYCANMNDKNNVVDCSYPSKAKKYNI